MGAAVAKADLCRSLETDREMKVVLERAASAFARSLRRLLSFVNAFGVIIGDPQLDVSLASDAKGDTPSGAMDLGGDQGFVRIACDTRLIDMCIEGALGGKRLSPRERVALSVAERCLMNKVLGDLAGELTTTFGSALGRPLPREAPRADALRGHQKLYVARFPVEGDGVEASFTITASRDVLHRENADGEVTAEPAHLNAAMAGLLQDVEVPIVAELGRVKVGLTSLLSLQVGDVLRLTAATDDPISVRVGGREKFGAVPVISRGQVSVEVQARRSGGRK
jgi:flagellar motor switch/type III secretory pathway protein FliN